MKAGSDTGEEQMPSMEIYFHIAINLGTITESPINKEAERGLESLTSIFNGRTIR